ncbi:MAG: hypothetical protein WDM85_11205 [Caulobacteraceae bacterium]
MPIQKTYTVGGVFEVGMSEYDQTFAYLPLTQAQRFFGRGDGVDYIEVKLDNPDLAPADQAGAGEAAGPGAAVSDCDREDPGLLGALHGRAQRDVPDPGAAGADRLAEHHLGAGECW